MKEASKNQQILAYFTRQKGCTLDTDAIAAMFGVHWRQVRNLADMNIGFCSTSDRGHTIEVFDDNDILLRSTTSDSRESRRPLRRQPRLPGRVVRKGIESTDN